MTICLQNFSQFGSLVSVNKKLGYATWIASNFSLNTLIFSFIPSYIFATFDRYHCKDVICVNICRNYLESYLTILTQGSGLAVALPVGVRANLGTGLELGIPSWLTLVTGHLLVLFLQLC